MPGAPNNETLSLEQVPQSLADALLFGLNHCKFFKVFNFLNFKYLFIWLSRVLVAAQRIFAASGRVFPCSAQTLQSQHSSLVAPQRVGS